MSILKLCKICKIEFSIPLCRDKTAFFCSKSCAITYRNKIDNPSWKRDLSGEHNPMFGKHPIAWNKGKIGIDCHNWTGGIHKRKDGYIRVNVRGKRYLQHRYLLKDLIDNKKVIHHKDKNPSNNSIGNLQILSGQSEHAKLHFSL